MSEALPGSVMVSITMSDPQQSTSWPLARGEALRLPAAGHARWLRVIEGEIWLTRDGTAENPPEDCWLARGSLSLLPAGVEVVVEGHPAASFQLLEPAVGRVSAAAASARARAASWRDWIRRFSFEPAPPPCAV